MHMACGGQRLISNVFLDLSTLCVEAESLT